MKIMSKAEYDNIENKAIKIERNSDGTFSVRIKEDKSNVWNGVIRIGSNRLRELQYLINEKCKELK